MRKMKKALSFAAIAAAVVSLAPIEEAFAGDDHRRDRHHQYHDRDHDRGRHHHQHHYHRPPPPPPPVVYHYYAPPPPPRPPATVIYRDVYRDYPTGNSFMLNVQIDGRR
jgi:ABC-type Zn2+ transport system substrate-binding protein/surface adhesin